jgi:hypothetical protein
MVKAPFPWFGGKSRVAPLVWQRFGDVKNYIEPFFGSGAVLLDRPPTAHATAVETVNDLDCYLANFWRATQHDPEQVAHWADQPVNEADLHARHLWLLDHKPHKTMADPDWFDAKIAVWWVWGLCCWIGGGWCSGNGPWTAGPDGVVKTGDAGRGVKRQLPHLGDAGQGVNRPRVALLDWFEQLRDRLRHVRICCGDFERVLGNSVLDSGRIWMTGSSTGVFLDPPYLQHDRTSKVYTHDDGNDVAVRAYKWAIEHGDNPHLRIAYCGYEGHFKWPSNWTEVPWKANGGYANQSGHGRDNASRERIWFSPHCKNFETALTLL